MSTLFSRKTYTFTQIVDKTTNNTVYPQGVILYNESTFPYGVKRRIRAVGKNLRIYELKLVRFPVINNLIAGVTPISTNVTYNSALNDNDINTSATYSLAPLGEVWFTWDLGSPKYIYCLNASILNQGASVYIQFYVSLDNVTYYQICNIASIYAYIVYAQAFGYGRYVRLRAYNTSTSVTVNTALFDTAVIDLESSGNPYVVDKVYIPDFGFTEYEVKSYAVPVSILVMSDVAWTYYIYDLDNIKLTISEGELYI